MVRSIAAMSLTFLFAAVSSAQDVAKVNPTTITVKLDNERVRVLDAVLPPGHREQMHSHPSSIVYVITGGAMRNHAADGKVSESTLKDGEVLYREPLTHWAENIGTTTMHLVVVELKPGSERTPGRSVANPDR